MDLIEFHLPFGIQRSGYPCIPPDRLIENRQRLDVCEVVPVDGLRPDLEVIIADHPVRVAYDRRHHRRWECPRCRRLCRFLYLPELWCWRCCGLDHACRHVGRNLPIVYNIRRWRRQLGADPAPFAPLTWNPRGRQRVRRLVDKVQAAEAELLASLTKMNDDLERRLMRESQTAAAGRSKPKQNQC